VEVKRKIIMWIAKYNSDGAVNKAKYINMQYTKKKMEIKIYIKIHIK